MKNVRHKSSPDFSELVFETAWGWCGARLSDAGILSFCLPERKVSRAVELLESHVSRAVAVLDRDGELQSWDSAERRNLATNLAAQVREYFEGRRRGFDLSVDWRGRTEFQKAIWGELQRVPFGKTIGYGELAARAGRAGAARAVGRAMATNPTPLIVPCHRVVGAGGALHGFSAPGGVEFKRRLLDFELECCAVASS